MPISLPRLVIGAAAALAIGDAALAQTPGTSASSATHSAKASSTSSAAGVARSARKAASTDMNTAGSSGGVAPTGPDTNVGVSSEPSDLSGSTGASVNFPAATAPPGVAPPGGVPDTGGGEAPNVDGGPH